MPSSHTPINALVFDAYGTLFDVYSVAALCEDVFPGKGDALATLWRTKQLQYSLLRSMMDRYKDFWQVTEDGLIYSARSLKLDLTPGNRARLMDAYLTLSAFPDVKPGLEQLKAMRVRLAILSNGAPPMLAAASQAAGISHLFDAVISVDLVQTFKPSPRVYALVEAQLGVRGPGTGFVSANSWDVQGASAAGLQAFWIQRSAAEPPEELGYPAGGVVRAITELCALVV